MHLDLITYVLRLTYLQLQNIPGAEWTDCEILEEGQLHYGAIWLAQCHGARVYSSLQAAQRSVDPVCQWAGSTWWAYVHLDLTSYRISDVWINKKQHY